MLYSIRAEQTKDSCAIKEVNDLAFGREDESSLIEAIRSSEHFVPQLSLVAETSAGEVVGHILFSKIGIETEGGFVTSLALAPMAVKPDYQQRGIGSDLVREGLSRCAEAGYGSVIVLGHPQFYPKFGFIPASEKKLQGPFDVQDQYFMVCETQIGSLSGVEGMVRYPESFFNV